jgi:hypothetical protein
MVSRVVRARCFAPKLAEERRNGWKSSRAVLDAARGITDQRSNDTDRRIGESLDQGDERIRAQPEVGVRNAEKRRLALGERSVVVGAESFLACVDDELGRKRALGLERNRVGNVLGDDEADAVGAVPLDVG